MRASKRLLRPLGLAAGALLVPAVAVLATLWVTLPDPSRLARENPRTTALIEQRRAEARAQRRPFRPRQVWIGPERIAPVVVDALVLSEDANFFGHEGVDWEAIRVAAEHDLKVGRYARGASTLTQQLAKNLWLGTEKSLWRKAKEAVLAAKLERALGKRRILTLYLNVVELADGVFGVEAGARARFGASAAAVTPAQAVVLVSLLPAPRRVDLAHPSSWLKGRARRLLDRLRDHDRLDAEAHRRASAELERILAGPAPADDEEEPPEEEPAAAQPAEVAAREPAAAAQAADDAPPPVQAPVEVTAADGPAAPSPAHGGKGDSGTAAQAVAAPHEHGPTAGSQE